MENQKEAIERMLRQKGKKKREMAAYLDITENSINRMLRNSNIGVGKLQKIADFLGVELIELLPSTAFSEENCRLQPDQSVINGNVVEKLSEALLASNRTNESQSKTIEKLVNTLDENKNR